MDRVIILSKALRIIFLVITIVFINGTYCKSQIYNGGEFSVSQTEVDGNIKQYVYFNQGTMIALLTEKTVYIGTNFGKEWIATSTPARPLAIIKDPLDDKYIYIITDSNVIHHNSLGGIFTDIVVPNKPAEGISPLSVLRIHPKKDRMLWLGQDGDKSSLYISSKSGSFWIKLQSYVENCNFLSNSEFKAISDDYIACVGYENKDGPQINNNGPKTFIYSKDTKNFITALKNILNYTTSSAYLAVVVKDEKNTLYISKNGEEFAPAKLPYNGEPKGYTIMKGLSSSLFLDIATSSTTGNLVFSNWNGTVYKESLNNLFKDSTTGVTDFERISGVEGVLIANILDGEAKKSKISLDDGETWNDLKLIKNGGIGKDTLHIHTYTERKNKRDTHAVDTSRGYMIAVGNEGTELKTTERNTYFSKDGGSSWYLLKEGDYEWEFVDMSQIIILASSDKKQVIYSLDMGTTFSEKSIIDIEENMNIEYLFSDPKGIQPYATLIGKVGETYKVFTISFVDVWKKDCDKGADISFWTPRGGACIFGHNSVIARRRPESYCSIRKIDLQEISETKPCLCTETDFECAYNYENVNGECKLISGLMPLRECVNNQMIQFGPYVKYKQSSCSGGEMRIMETNEGKCSSAVGSFFRFIWGFTKFLFISIIIIGIIYLIYEKFFNNEGRIRLVDNNEGFSYISNISRTVVTTGIILWSTISFWGALLLDKVLRRETSYQPINVWGSEHDANLYDFDVEEY